MKKWLFLLLFSVIIVGCGQQDNDTYSDDEQINLESKESIIDDRKLDTTVAADGSVENETNKETTNISNETESEDGINKSLETNSKSSVDLHEIDIEFIRNELKIGMSKQEILELIGEPNKTGIDSKNSNPLWLYNIRSEKNYYFETPLEDPKLIDTIDTEGLKNREVDIILFISWEDEKVIYISANYTDEQGNFKDYRLLEDGTALES